MSDLSDLYEPFRDVVRTIEEHANQISDGIIGGCVVLPLREYRQLVSVENYFNRQNDKLRGMVRIENGQAIVSGEKIEKFYTDFYDESLYHEKKVVIVWDDKNEPPR